jgi:predicted esterase
MRPVVLLVLLAVVTLGTLPAGGDWRNALDELLRAADNDEKERLIEQVLGEQPSCEDVAASIAALPFAPFDERGVPIVRTTVCADSVARPWVVVPEAYDPRVPTPLLVVLHGGVSSPEMTDDPVLYVEEDPLVAMAIERGWLAVHPFGQEGVTWWDEVGMANIWDLVRTAKREFNVDDDRVWMAGFSDGASAAFLHAMVAPSDYAPFVALNGHMGVGSLAGDLPMYAPNLVNSPVYAVTTKGDELYLSLRLPRTIASSPTGSSCSGTSSPIAIGSSCTFPSL